MKRYEREEKENCLSGNINKNPLSFGFFETIRHCAKTILTYRTSQQIFTHCQYSISFAVWHDELQVHRGLKTIRAAEIFTSIIFALRHYLSNIINYIYLWTCVRFTIISLIPIMSRNSSPASLITIR